MITTRKRRAWFFSGLLALHVVILPSSVLAEKIVVAEPIATAEQRAVDILPVTKSNAPATLAVTSAASAGIATLTIFADPTASTIGSSGLSFDLGTHAFITVKNISSSNISIGKLSGIAPGKTISIGTWGNKSEHKGLWYNLESYLVSKNSAYGGRVSYSAGLTSASLSALNSYIKSNDSWSNTNNCSSFAVGAWNSAVSTTNKLNAGVPNTPKKLASNIKAKWPSQYKAGLSVPHNYVVYFAQGSGSPLKSSVFK